ncbi:farnesyl diphosphate synthase [Multifurca ochricompacta]|uniref:Farnesyl diphosphate synthase n=1 Tax=Multifurca ochricompacta TaxID=376703 RepID=A0AAD4M6P3_9AGAM|nr:farnesyl diphosphate synthase [Multifurca ochricompacta]
MATSSSAHSRGWSSSTVSDAVALDHFEVLYPYIQDFLLSQFSAHSMPTDAIEYFARCLDYNAFRGKYRTGLVVIMAAEGFKGRELDDLEYQKAAVLGWAVVLLHSYFLVSENIVDDVKRSLGKLPWHLEKGVGLKAINDALLLEGAVFQLIREHFRNETYYLDLLELLHETRHPAFFRNPVPVSTTKSLAYAHGRFILQRTANIYKFAIYSYYLPMALSMIFCGFPVEKVSPIDSNYYDFVLDILLPLGEYVQIQSEYFESRTGNLPKTRSWCYDVVRTSGSPELLAALELYFGKDDVTSQLEMRRIFDVAGIDKRYEQYSEDAYTRISGLIDALPELRSPSGDSVLRRTVFHSLLEHIHSRTE